MLYSVLNCILSKNIILTIMDFKLSDTDNGKEGLEVSFNKFIRKLGSIQQ